MNKILETLNSEQQDAAITTSKYTQIVAGPGTGKTTTMAAKILYTQLELNIDIDNILGISFSNSAKNHLLNKLEEFTNDLGYGANPMILTFHSFAYQIIKFGIRYNESRFRIGLKPIATEEFIKLDPALTKDLCRDYANRDIVNIALARAYNLARQGNMTKVPIENWSELHKNKTIHIKTYEQGRIRINSNDLITYWKRINKIEKIKNITDFQGLISEACCLLSSKKQTFQYIVNRYTHIFVDEYQDTSLAQEKLLFLLMNKINNITVVGDKNQAIYTFNGSNYLNMDRFINRCSEINLEETKVIHLTKNYRSTNEIIDLANHFINANNIKPAVRTNGVQPDVIETHSIQLAAKYIANKIQALVKQQEISLSDICILYRKNSEFSPQADEVYKELDELTIAYTTAKKETKNENLVEQIIEIQTMYEDQPLDEVIEKLKLRNDDVSNAVEFIQNCFNEGAYDTDDLSEYLVELIDTNYEFKNEEKNALSVKTIHEAKGLEFPIVFILYLGDREFPHSSDPDIEEERRLLYVALTRAKKQLYVVGERGIEFDGFLDNCITSKSNHILYHSSKEEENNEGFSKKNKAIIDQTTRQLEDEEIQRQKELQKLMELFEE